MGRLVSIRIKDYVDQVYSNDDGMIIYNELKKHFENDSKISVSFKEINALNSSFINSAFIGLLNDYDFQFIKENLRFVDSTKQINDAIKSKFSFELNKNKVYN
ncbi:STAS-like domain-containing protein [Peribacillus frigoritolerans]|uniref:STAS-like domain-containing protein n=1 Tax=Peribacillus frigoritolerans TaxID=450367 RepID=UPI00345CCF77